ncbi:hypothetical protein F4777DRAFT_145933 [Nemania sp. FL0916]|nr:hypothetical protein F4777DRAFT_145933 [Nemania sp. FL0916]
MCVLWRTRTVLPGSLWIPIHPFLGENIVLSQAHLVLPSPRDLRLQTDKLPTYHSRPEIRYICVCVCTIPRVRISNVRANHVTHCTNLRPRATGRQAGYNALPPPASAPNYSATHNTQQTRFDGLDLGWRTLIVCGGPMGGRPAGSCGIPTARSQNILGVRVQSSPTKPRTQEPPAVLIQLICLPSFPSLPLLSLSLHLPLSGLPSVHRDGVIGLEKHALFLFLRKQSCLKHSIANTDLFS